MEMDPFQMQRELSNFSLIAHSGIECPYEEFDCGNDDLFYKQRTLANLFKEQEDHYCVPPTRRHRRRRRRRIEPSFKPPCTPSYWTKRHSQKPLSYWNSQRSCNTYELLKVDDDLFDDVKNLVTATWDSHNVGRGRDAYDLGRRRRIRVRDVTRVENTTLFQQFCNKRQEMCQKAAKSGAFIRIEDVKGSTGKIGTSRNIPYGSDLRKDIYPAVNEHYLFHGTTNDTVRKIIHQGLDLRLARKGLFGRGIYCAESSTKADQYSDSRHNGIDDSSYMFLVRVCLGGIFIERGRHPYARPPCKECFEDKTCSCDDTEFFDSVVGDGAVRFREFVVYDRAQVYPEYLIRYKIV